MPNHWLSRVQACTNTHMHTHTHTHAWWMGCVTFLQLPKKKGAGAAAKQTEERGARGVGGVGGRWMNGWRLCSPPLHHSIIPLLTAADPSLLTVEKKKEKKNNNSALHKPRD